MGLSRTVWPQFTIVADSRTTENTLAIPTRSLLAMSRQKPMAWLLLQNTVYIKIHNGLDKIAKLYRVILPSPLTGWC